MAFLFLFLGYMGVPVAFALIASVLVVTAFTPVSLASMMAQLFNGIDVEALLAVPFFLLVGDLMTSANVTVPHDHAVADDGRTSARRTGAGGDASSACSLRVSPARPPPTSRSCRARLRRK